MEDRVFNRLVDGILDNDKRVKKICQCTSHPDRINMAMRYAVACAKDDKVMVTEEDIWHVAFAAVMTIDHSEN